MIIYNGQANKGKPYRVTLVIAAIFSLFLFGNSIMLNAATGSVSNGEITSKSTERYKVLVRYVILKQPATFRTAKGETIETSKVVEFRLISSSTIPARGYDPVIVIGKQMITDYQYVSQNELVFIEYHPESLRNGNDIYFQWGPTPVKQQRWKLSTVYNQKEIEQVYINKLDDLYKARPN